MLEFRSLLSIVVVMGVAGTAAVAAPLTPVITGHDINFGAYNTDGVFEYATNRPAPDTLTFTREPVGAPGTDHEATAYWPAWPLPPVRPIFNGAGFGGDFVLYVQFDAQDAPYVGPGGIVDVSLTGTGANPVGVADLEIYGTLDAPGAAPAPLLWALDLESVSLYGYSGGQWGPAPAPPPAAAYVLEGVGTILGGEIAEQNGLIGETGVMRGNLDFFDRPADWIPPLYDPADDVDYALRAAYSGETGVGVAVPEPATLGAMLGLGALGIRRRRR